MDFDDPPEQQIDLTFNQHKLANFALTITPPKEMRAAGRPSIIQIESHCLGSYR
jgi:hypothetical protein